MWTQALTRRISSSNSRLRLMLLKKILPPASSPIRAGLFLFRRNVPARLHAVRHSVLRERSFVLAADVRVLHPVGNGRASVRDVHAGVLDRLLARRARLEPRAVRAQPSGQAERVLRPAVT